MPLYWGSYCIVRTTALEPPFPVDLGSWLANFRHRRRDVRGHPLSPESIGQEIGVSGATIRRWEAGLLQPHPSDVANLAVAYQLTPNQTAFLMRALRPQDAVAPSVEVFRKRAASLLKSDFPGYIMDSLLFIRAWNSHLEVTLSDPASMYAGKHVIEQVLSLNPSPERRPALAERLRWLTREFWYFTADFCGQDAYRRLILRLAEWDQFKEEWCQLPFIEADEEQVIGISQEQERPEIGRYRLMGSLALIPPIYILHEFMPLDEKARAIVDRLAAGGPPAIRFGTVSHWAEEQRVLVTGAGVPV
jgi:transcriptional regulator with XRE-family HTH domain